MAHPPRYGDASDWPDYPYLPGRDPHPTRDPRGHSFAAEESDARAPAPTTWRQSRLYLRGADLYNAGFHWEAHEAWESLWMRPVDVVQRELLQALIQAAAAALQERMGRPQGRRRLATRAAARLRHVQSLRGPRWMGVDVGAFAAALGEFAESGGTPPPLWLRVG